MEYTLKNNCIAPDFKNIKDISVGLNIEPILAMALSARGIKGIKEACEFLNPSKEQLNNPYLFKDMENAVKLILKKISEKESICIYGDYDVDGISGSAILYRTLKKIGADVGCILPSRLEHGYGLSSEAIKGMGKYGLLITVDCGITNIDEINLANCMGLSVIITDHHECGDILPNADYILNPKRIDETYPCRDLCGAGIAYKLAYALIGKDADEYMDIAAIATIADIVPLIGENRVIAKLGLDKLNTKPNKGISKLISSAALRLGKIDSREVAFKLGPRMNAAGRINSARIVFDLLVSDDENKLNKLAEEINKLNAERQKRQEIIIENSLEMEEKYPSDKFIMHAADNWDVGIIGLAASKLTEKYNKPTLLLAKVNNKYIGSARSIDGINIYEALSTQVKLYEKFGGHPGAAGLTIKQEHLETIKNQINLYLNKSYPQEIFYPSRSFDIELSPKDITKNALVELNKLQPFGYKNEPVTILFKNSNILNIKSVGGGKHSRFILKKGGYSINAIAFGKKWNEMPQKADIVGFAQINDYDGFPQIMVDAISYPPTNEELFKEAQEYINKCIVPIDKQKYYCNRRELGDIFSLIKVAYEKRISFNYKIDIINLIIKNLPHITIQKATFALCVFQELKLIEINKSANINIVVSNKKCDLNNCKTYKKFLME